MAKKAVRKSSRAGRQSSDVLSTSKSTRSRSRTMDRDYKDVLRELAANPAVRYVAGGIATAVLARIASNLSDRYPELSNFIKENLENVEGRLGDFKDSLADSARH